ncbi:hypothetical protein ACHAQH_008235 [Verticillium albo-atrum]
MSRPTRAPTSKAPTSLINRERSMARGELAVGISSTYRAYYPGRRRLAPITLLPIHDTTAYILDEYKVPPSSEDGRVHISYLVGWTDLPAGMISVDASCIHEYVSAREYEEWNAKKAAERDEELRKEEEAENVRLVEEAEKRETGIVLRNGTLRIPGQGTFREHAVADAPRKGKKKRGRSSHQRIPSLSKPGTHAALVPLESGDTETEALDDVRDEEASIRRQLEGEETTGDSESLEYSSRAVSTLSDRGNGITTSLEPPPKKRRTISPFPLQRKEPLRELDAGRAGGSAKPRYLAHQSSQDSSVVRSPQMPPVEHQTTQASTHKKQQHGTSFEPVSQPPPVPHAAASDAQTGVPIRSLPAALSDSTPIASATAQQRTSSTQSATPRVGFTPLGSRRSSPWASFTSCRNNALQTSSGEPSTQTKSTEPHASESSPAKPPPDPKRTAVTPPVAQTNDEDESEEVYEVKRLEATKLYDTEQGPQRWFLVRWKGSWPKGQNPTWEPEENIPKDLARKFMMKQGVAMGMDGANNTPRRSASSQWQHQKKSWSSVSEAFAGVDDDFTRGDGNPIKPKDEEDLPQTGGFDADEPLLVTDEPSPARKPRLNWDMLMGRKFGDRA